MVIHSSFVRNVWISATPRISSHPFTYPHLWTLLISNSLLNMMKTSLALVIRLSLTYPHVLGKAWMNNHQASYLVSIRLIFFILGVTFLLWCIMTIDIKLWRIAVGSYGKSVILIKGTWSYSFSCESYLFLLLSLVCIVLLYLYYALLGHTFDQFSFLIRSKINNLTDCSLSLHFLWILYFLLRLLQHGDTELNPGPKYLCIYLEPKYFNCSKLFESFSITSF